MIPYRLRGLAAVVTLSFVAAVPACGQSDVVVRSAPESIADFRGLVSRLSDAGGYFDTDNLISNERGYQQVLSAMNRMGVKGGAYIGVGPDQNYTYIARIRPRIAIIADIRRDNMLQHLLFKALFARSANRAEYLALWTGRPVPANIAAYTDRSIDAITAWIDSAVATSASKERARQLVREEAARSGIPLSPDDLATISRFHDAFIADGLSLRFVSTGRAPQWYYPTLRQLILEHDADGQQRSYLASEADFKYLKSMHRRNLIVPVTGDVAGSRTLPAIARYLKEIQVPVSAFYVSNVEDYLIRDGRFPTYVAGVRTLPRDSNAVIIRSYFGRGGGHPESTPEYFSTQLLQRLDRFARDASLSEIRNYWDLVSRDYVPLRKR